MQEYSDLMIIAALACIIVLVLAVFLHRTMDLDIAASIVAAVVTTAVLSLIIAGAVYAGRLF